jgi:hypothetical protein
MLTVAPCLFFYSFSPGWKRLLLADGPRQVINGLTLWSIYLSKSNDPGNWYDVTRYFRGQKLQISALTVTTFFTVVIFVGSMLLLIAAAIFYIPLLCYIQGNLKVSLPKMREFQPSSFLFHSSCRNMFVTKLTSASARSSNGETRNDLRRQPRSPRRKQWATTPI